MTRSFLWLWEGLRVILQSPSIFQLLVTMAVPVILLTTLGRFNPVILMICTWLLQILTIFAVSLFVLIRTIKPDDPPLERIFQVFPLLVSRFAAMIFFIVAIQVVGGIVLNELIANRILIGLGLDTSRSNPFRTILEAVIIHGWVILIWAWLAFAVPHQLMSNRYLSQFLRHGTEDGKGQRLSVVVVILIVMALKGLLALAVVVPTDAGSPWRAALSLTPAFGEFVKEEPVELYPDSGSPIGMDEEAYTIRAVVYFVLEVMGTLLIFAAITVGYTRHSLSFRRLQAQDDEPFDDLGDRP